jgi:hypothetical protein
MVAVMKAAAVTVVIIVVAVAVAPRRQLKSSRECLGQRQ